MSTSKRISYHEMTDLYCTAIDNAINKLFSDNPQNGWTREDYENLANEVEVFEDLEVCNEDTIH